MQFMILCLASTWATQKVNETQKENNPLMGKGS